MRDIDVGIIKDKIKEMCIEANCILNDDIYCSIQKARDIEKSEIGKDILNQIIKNADLAKQKLKPICQDTGMAVVFIEAGQDVHFINGNINDAINEGVREGYKEGYLRKSVVNDPILRVNTFDNTPAVIHYYITAGDKVKRTIILRQFFTQRLWMAIRWRLRWPRRDSEVKI